MTKTKAVDPVASFRSLGLHFSSDDLFANTGSLRPLGLCNFRRWSELERVSRKSNVLTPRHREPSALMGLIGALWEFGGKFSYSFVNQSDVRSSLFLEFLFG